MKIHSLKTSQFVRADLDHAWDFFSSPANLGKITPPSMDFVITSDPADKMYAGQIITYTVRPFPFMKLSWVTEITHVTEKQYFVDEQRFGPYAFWHHQHKFTVVPGGVQMDDVVHFGIPFGFVGGIFLPLVRRKLAEIFAFRTQKVTDFFPNQ